MQIPLRISEEHIYGDNRGNHIIDMTGRCAFAVCSRGVFEIKIFNELYTVTPQCMFACMPFVNIEVVSVSEPGEIIFGYIQIGDVPMMINRWVNTNNLGAIQNRPLVRITDSQYGRLMASLADYRNECNEIKCGCDENICNRIQQDIIDLRSRLIVAEVLKIYFANMHLEVSGPTHSDVVFQRFMLSLYGNVREHRNVLFYAARSGVSLKYFSTVVRQLSGTSPSEWIETVLVGEAKSMLADNHRSIKDIATALNFPDAPTFTKYFRRITGITPKAYRKEHL